METPVFKCCKNKNCPNLCCVRCHSIFHASCIAGKRSIKRLEMHKILCSKECEKEYLRAEDGLGSLESRAAGLYNELQEKNLQLVRVTDEREGEVKELQQEIDRLSAANADMTSYISRKKRETSDFHDEVLAAERQLEEELGLGKKTISNLNMEIVKLMERGSALQDGVALLESRVRELEACIGELGDVNRSLLTTIETLSQENECNVGLLKLARYEICKLKEKNGCPSVDDYCAASLRVDDCGAECEPSADAALVHGREPVEGCSLVDNAVLEPTGLSDCAGIPRSNSLFGDGFGRTGASGSCESLRRQKKRQVVIFGDDSGSGLAVRLAGVLDGREYNVLGIVHSGGDLAKICSDVFDVSRCLTSHDYIVFTFNVENSLEINRHYFEKLLSVGRYTNVLFYMKCFYKYDAIMKNFDDLITGSLLIGRSVSFKYIYDTHAVGKNALRNAAQNVAKCILCGFPNGGVVLKSLTTGMGSEYNSGNNHNMQFFRTRG